MNSLWTFIFRDFGLGKLPVLDDDGQVPCRALGMKPDDPHRAVAAVEATLYRCLDRNHTWMPRASAEASPAKLLVDMAAPDNGPAGPWAVEAAVQIGGAEPFEDGTQLMGAAKPW